MPEDTSSAQHVKQKRGNASARPKCPVHVLMAGASTSPVCGVRDHASRLAQGMREFGRDVTTVWMDGGGSPPRLGAFTRDLLAHVDSKQADAVVLHYSVFAYAWRGIPVGVPMMAARLRRARTPMILFAHEYAYPWVNRRGWRGSLLAMTQRLVLPPLLATFDAVVVTTGDRAEWIRSRWWLPRVPVVCAPVFSNIPVAPTSTDSDAVPGRVGVFSFGAESLHAELVIQSMARARGSSPDAHLRLIGGPGPESEVGRHWQQLADIAGCVVSFSGIVSEEQISRELSTCQAIIHTDPSGPTSKKSSLAAALIHGRPVLAFDGPQCWDELAAAEAVALVPLDVNRTAEALGAILSDGVLRARLGERASTFAAAHLTPSHTARAVLDALDRLAHDGAQQ